MCEKQTKKFVELALYGIVIAVSKLNYLLKLKIVFF